MKNTFFIFLIIFIPFVLLSKSGNDNYYWNKLTYNNFIMWMKSIDIPEFELKQIKKEGSENAYNIEYSAMFVDKNHNMLNVRIGNKSIFYQYEDLKAYVVNGPYSFDGFPAVFIYNKKLTKPSNLTYELIQFPNLKATFSISALTRKRLKKNEMEYYVKFFNLHSVGESNMLIWPIEITIPFRVPGEMTAIEKKEVNSDQVEYEYHIKFAKSKLFLKNLKAFYERNQGWLDLLTFKDFNLICKTANSFEELNKLKDGDFIEFVYYKKKI